MKQSIKLTPTRDLFAELSEGMEALANARQGTRTLRTHVIELKSPRLAPPTGLNSRHRKHQHKVDRGDDGGGD